MQPSVQSSILYNSQDMEATEMSINRRTDRGDTDTHTHTHTHTHAEACCSAVKKSEIMPFASTWMDLGIIILSEVNQSKMNSNDITYTYNLKYDTNELI